VDWAISAARTLVPLVAAWLISAAGFFGVPVGEGQATAAAVLVVAAAWWSAGRGLEWAGDRLGWAWLRHAGGVMVGWPRQPAYRRPGVPEDLEGIVRAIQGDGGR